MYNLDFSANGFVVYLKLALQNQAVNPLRPNDHYSGRTAPLNSQVSFYIFIQQI